MINIVHFSRSSLMASPLRLRERLRSFFSPNMDEILEESKIMLGNDIEREFNPLEIPQAEIGDESHPPIPDKLTSRQFRQKKLVSGMEQLLPEILEESKKYGDEVQIFLAICCVDSLERTEAKFFFTEKDLEEAKGVIIQWAQHYQNINYMLPSVMATVHWGFTPIIW